MQIDNQPVAASTQNQPNKNVRIFKILAATFTITAGAILLTLHFILLINRIISNIDFDGNYFRYFDLYNFLLVFGYTSTMIAFGIVLLLKKHSAFTVVPLTVISLYILQGFLVLLLFSLSPYTSFGVMPLIWLPFAITAAVFLILYLITQIRLSKNSVK